MKTLFFSIFLTFNLSAETVSVGVETLDYAPFYSGKGRNYAGMSRDIMDAFAQDNAKTFNYAPYKINQLYDNYLAGKVDIKFPDNALWQKEKRDAIKGIEYSKVVISTEVGVVVPSGMETKKISKVGIVDGFTPWTLLDKVESKEITLFKESSAVKLISMLEAGEIEGIYASLDVIKYHASGKKYVISTSYPTNTDEFHLSSFKNTALIRKFNEWFDANQDKVKKIKAQYLK